MHTNFSIHGSTVRRPCFVIRACAAALGLGLLATVATSAGAATITIPSGNFGGQVGLFEGSAGLTRNRSLGQTFEVPAPASENVLRRLVFELNASSLSPDFDFSARVYRFDPASRRTVGAVLFDSGALLLAPGAAPVDVVLKPNITLDAGATYLAFVSTQGGANDDDSRSGNVPVVPGPYADGAFAVQFDDAFAPLWESDQWQLDFSSDVGGFEAHFASTVPLPPAFGLLGLALCGLAGRRRRAGATRALDC